MKKLISLTILSLIIITGVINTINQSNAYLDITNQEQRDNLYGNQLFQLNKSISDNLKKYSEATKVNHNGKKTNNDIFSYILTNTDYQYKVSQFLGESNYKSIFIDNLQYNNSIYITKLIKSEFEKSVNSGKIKLTSDIKKYPKIEHFDYSLDKYNKLYNDKINLIKQKGNANLNYLKVNAIYKEIKKINESIKNNTEINDKNVKNYLALTVLMQKYDVYNNMYYKDLKLKDNKELNIKLLNEDIKTYYKKVVNTVMTKTIINYINAKDINSKIDISKYKLIITHNAWLYYN